jgi:hypothetical protein
VASTQPESGLVPDNPHVHAAQRSIFGHRAVCGAGRIFQMLAGRFDLEDRLGCPACVEIVAERQRLAGA